MFRKLGCLGDVGCLGFVMLRMWYVQDVGCLGFRMFRMGNV